MPAPLWPTRESLTEGVTCATKGCSWQTGCGCEKGEGRNITGRVLMKPYVTAMNAADGAWGARRPPTQSVRLPRRLRATKAELLSESSEVLLKTKVPGPGS